MLEDKDSEEDGNTDNEEEPEFGETGALCLFICLCHQIITSIKCSFAFLTLSTV